MREIRFRAWDRTLNQHLPNVQNHIGSDGWAFGNMLNDERYIIEQFTGLKDKNGTPIYENDLIEAEGDVLRVYWSDDEAAWKLDDMGKHEFWPAECGEFAEEVKNSAHIGNIHQNAELLEDKS